MGDIVKLALRLFLFALVAAVLLAATNEVTKGPILEQEMASKREALSKVLPGCDAAPAELTGLAEDSEITEIYAGTNADGEIAGYALSAAPNGYGGPIPITLGVSTEGYVTQVYVGALQETAGLGSRVGEAEFMDQFTAIAADPDTLRDDVSTLSGATVSSTAFIGAVEEMLTYTRDTLGIEPHAGDRDAILAAAAEASGESAESAAATGSYEVKGFAPFAVEIAVDEAGKIVSVAVPEHGETEGFGADLIADQSVFDALAGQDIATAQIDVRAGATLTSNAINDALKQAAEATGFAAAEPEAERPAGDAYTVKGMNKFTLYIDAQDGKIVSVSAPVHEETPGLGADLLTEEALGALAGQDLATAKVDVKSGVTLTSNAINAALAQAAAANGVALPEPEPTAEPTAEPVAEPAAQSGGAMPDEAKPEPITAEVKGIDTFTVAVACDNLGKIVSVEIPEHHETPGYGADLIEDKSVFDALVGQDIATAQIDVRAGATLTSNAINEALREIAEKTPVNLPLTLEDGAAPVATAHTYDVKGIDAFKVSVTLGADGKIVSVTVPEHHETEGYGADLIADQSVFDALAGQDIATAQIDVRAGATLTSNAINDALKQAAKEVR